MKRRALLVFAMSAAVLAGCAAEPAPVSDKVQQYYDSHKTLAPVSTRPAVEKVPIAPGTKTVIFGDSWTAGYAAAPSTQGYAYLTATALGWDNAVLGVSGTGYQNPGPKKEGTYQARLAALPVEPDVQLLVIQGGINDAGQPSDRFRQAVSDTITAAKQKFPTAKIVILGPATPTLPASPELVAINSTLFDVASEQKMNYISPMNDLWITANNYAAVIDTKSLNHPSTAGHAYLADKTVAALRAIGQ